MTSEILMNYYYYGLKALFSSYLAYFWNSVNRIPVKNPIKNMDPMITKLVNKI